MRREMENVFGMGPGDGPAGAAKTQWTAVHLLSAQEVTSLFRDVVEGLAFLVRSDCAQCLIFLTQRLRSTANRYCIST